MIGNFEQHFDPSHKPTLENTVSPAYESQALRQERAAYETTLADCCHYEGLLSVLTQHRPYFESLPSIRRLQESMVIIPLPNVRSREVSEIAGNIDTRYRIRAVPCDIALMVCDPEWQIKTGIEIVLFIQRPGEEFSDLLRRWRQTQVELGQGVEWLMPRQHKHLLSEGTEAPHPLFVVFAPSDDGQRLKTDDLPKTESTLELTSGSAENFVEHRSTNIIHGLTGANLPLAVQSLSLLPRQ